MHPVSLSPTWIMTNESVEGITEGKFKWEAKNMTSCEKSNLRRQNKTSRCRIVMLLLAPGFNTDRLTFLCWPMISLQALLTTYLLNLENVMSSAHTKICSVTSYEVMNVIYQFFPLIRLRHGHRLYLLRLSMSGNYGSAIKMMGQDKRQSIWHILHGELFFPILWAVFVMHQIQKWVRQIL